MSRWVWFSILGVTGLALFGAGLLLPVYLRAVDAGVLRKAGRGTPSLAEHGMGLTGAQNLGAAKLLLQAAQTEKLPAANLDLAIAKLGREHPNWEVWGGADDYLAKSFKADVRSTNSHTEKFTEFIIRIENRDTALKILRDSRLPAVQELLRCQALTNTTVFPPSASASGQAFDAAIYTCGLLLSEWHLTPGLSNTVFRLATDANRGGSPQPLELVLVDLMSLGQRFNWGQIAIFVSRIEDPETLHRLAEDVRKAGGQVPELFSAVQLSGNPAGVAAYLMNFSQTGLKDLAASLRYGTGGINELLRRNRQLYVSNFRQQLAGDSVAGNFVEFAQGYALRQPQPTLVVKWLLYLAAGFLVAVALHFVRPAVSFLEQPLQVRGIHLVRESLFALGFLLLILLVSEPFLAQDSQKAGPLLRLRLPTAGNVVAAGITGGKPSTMNQTNLNLITLLAFFVVQGLLYLSCLLKLAEIRRQKIGADMKLKLLKNEEHLFDGGLYLGFAGTIVSLILVSMKVTSFSLMAAYSSTSFGIIFVFVFKIFNLRPLRRQLLLEADAATRERQVRAAAPATAAAPLS